MFEGLRRKVQRAFAKEDDGQQEAVPENQTRRILEKPFQISIGLTRITDTSQGRQRNDMAKTRDGRLRNILFPEERRSHEGEPWTEAGTRELAILYFFGHYEFRTNAGMLSETATALRGTPRTEEDIRTMSIDFHKPEWRDGHIYVSRATEAVASAQEMAGTNWQVKSVFKRAEEAWMAAQEYSPESPLGKLKVWHGPNAAPLKVPGTRIEKLKKLSEVFVVLEEPKKEENDPIENTSFKVHREIEVNDPGSDDFENIGLD
ncbi:uncharacterized protein BDZ99DRAFT_526043 [Mytilinidion resinicola]|uniref:Uncharacterized protein n=1 Tax=Mytilinidion resinicola TaxID=574789 RepID=A0A6A6Y578_9PEZI|nr:uncharacterized protein BDZ99DRAFT_526043 [Mytilinidion resinicola]KAF2804001.1 hypothetical protein BDZ99DRAFT_526043 [Mytilinidion resinicola]